AVQGWNNGPWQVISAGSEYRPARSQRFHTAKIIRIGRGRFEPSGDQRAQAIPLALSQREQATARTVVWVATALRVKEPSDGNILAILLGLRSYGRFMRAP
ncbi:MAG TPA: hypothetical protein VN798_21455, partial [Pseudomonas sp.]|nr:hypothetical protein [Pseudomonas sp.]